MRSIVFAIENEFHGRFSMSFYDAPVFPILDDDKEVNQVGGEKKMAACVLWVLVRLRAAEAVSDEDGSTKKKPKKKPLLRGVSV